MGISLGLGVAFIALSPIPTAPEDTISTSIPAFLISAICLATRSMKASEGVLPPCVIEDVPTLITTLSTLASCSFLETMLSPP